MAVYLGEYQVGLGGLTDLSGASVVNNQNKTVNPSTSQQIVTFDSGYTGLGTVTVTAMPSLTLPTSTSGSATSGYSSKATIGRSTSDQYINIGTGYNAAGAYYKISAVPNGTAGTPTATKGTVSNYSITVTPSVTNTAGYISSETKTGTAVTVTASELVSGTLPVTSNGTKDVTNYASINVNVPTGSTINNQDKTVTPSTSEQSISADNGYTGLGTVTVEAMPAGTAGTPSASKGTVSNHSVSVTPSVTNTTGYITGGTKTGTAVTVSASELVSGSQTFTTNNTYDVTNLASVVVNVSGGGGGGTGAISVVDTTDTHGGTIRTITAVDISDTTAVASDVAQGKYFYTADGTKTAGTSSGSGGGGSSDDVLALSALYTAPAIDGAYSGRSSRGYVSLTIPNYLPFSAFPEGAHLPFVIKKGVQTIIVTGAQRSANVTFKEHTIDNWTENTGGFAYVTEGDDGFDLKIVNASTGDSSGAVTVNVNMPSVKFMIPSDLSVFADL